MSAGGALDIVMEKMVCIKAFLWQNLQILQLLLRLDSHTSYRAQR